MPQMNKGGKLIFGESVIRPDGRVQLPPQAVDEYRIASEGKAYLFTESKITGGCCLSAAATLLLPWGRRGRCWKRRHILTARSRCSEKRVRIVGDPTKFRYLWEYYSFHAVFACLLLSELLIFLYTMQRGSRTQTANGDHGTKWLLYGNFAIFLFISIYSVSQAAPVLLWRSGTFLLFASSFSAA